MKPPRILQVGGTRNDISAIVDRQEPSTPQLHYESVTDLHEARGKLASERPVYDLIIPSLALPDEEVLDLISFLQDKNPAPAVLFPHDPKAGERMAGDDNRLFKFIADHAGQEIYLVNLDGSFFYVNEAAADSLGYTVEELLEMGVADIDPEYGPVFDNHIQELKEKKQLPQLETEHVTKTGQRVPKEIKPVYLEMDDLQFICAFAHDISERKNLESQLCHLTTHDELTGMANRTLFSDRLEQVLHYGQRSEYLMAVLLLNLDRFKIINDSLGQEAGDELLRAVAQRLQKSVRGMDTVARLGGDEFAVLLAKVNDADNLAPIASRLLQHIAEPYEIEGRRIVISASIGISMCPGDSSEGATMVRNAGAALAQSKKNGGNIFSFYSKEINERALATLEMETALREALDREEFILHYQPVVDLLSGRIVSCEALVRWNHPQKGLIAPGEFIPLAEELGLIVPLGTWVLEEACRQIKTWQNQGIPGVSVAVNVSARQLGAGDLPDLVTQVLGKQRIPPSQLILELTESSLMCNPESAISAMDALKKLKIKLSLDDFGIGYSSLSYLQRFPFDYVKIDQSFVKEIAHDPDSATIASSIIAMGHRMGLKVIAEGVENEEQIGYLRKNNCDKIQGFHFSRPLPADDFALLLRNDQRLSAPSAAEHTEHTLLIVDDESNILASLRRLLQDEGYRLLLAQSAQEGLDLLARHNVQVILADQRMPKMSGTEFLERVKTMHPHTVRIVLSGYADLQTVLDAVNTGALYKFFAKPWSDDHLREQIHEAFIYYDAVIRPRQEIDGAQRLSN